MSTRSRTYAALVALFLTLSPASAQKVGTTSMQFLRVMPVARGTALGDAYVALATGVEAMFWNPGAMASTEGFQLSTTYIDWLFDTQQGAFGASMSLGDLGTFGVQVQFVDFGTFDEAIADPVLLTQSPFPGLTGRQFRPYSFLAGVSFARNLTDKFSAGLTAKFARESLFDRMHVRVAGDNGSLESVNTYADGLLFDFGLLYHTGFRSIRIAGVIQNFGSSLTYAKESSPAPLLFRLGIAADLLGIDGLMGKNEDGRLTAAVDMFQPNDYSQQIHAGLEYEFAGMIAVRAGYKFNYDVEGLTLGGGVKQVIAGTRLSLDYSYGTMGEFLGVTHRISIGAAL